MRSNIDRYLPAATGSSLNALLPAAAAQHPGRLPDTLGANPAAQTKALSGYKPPGELGELEAALYSALCDTPVEGKAFAALVQQVCVCV